MLHLSEARRIVFVALQVAPVAQTRSPARKTGWLLLCRIPTLVTPRKSPGFAGCRAFRRAVRLHPGPPVISDFSEPWRSPELDSISGCLIAFEVTSELGLQHSLQVLRAGNRESSQARPLCMQLAPPKLRRHLRRASWTLCIFL